MMEEFFTLITGRTRKQADGLHRGGGSTEHLTATSYVEIGQKDMIRLGITEGQIVKLLSGSGEVELIVHPANLPDGLVFIPMGPLANKLVGSETFGTGMPFFKGQQVQVVPL